jgi:hypothetical protein
VVTPVDEERHADQVDVERVCLLERLSGAPGH